MNLARRFCLATLHSASELLATSTDWQSGAAPIQDSGWLPALKRMTSAPVAPSRAHNVQSAPTLYTRPLLPAPAAYASEATPLQQHHRNFHSLNCKGAEVLTNALTALRHSMLERILETRITSVQKLRGKDSADIGTADNAWAYPSLQFSALQAWRAVAAEIALTLPAAVPTATRRLAALRLDAVPFCLPCMVL